ncbi:hypothetical protein ACP70R_015097 [Stipagrostis hirtigluma subsp. patula]
MAMDSATDDLRDLRITDADDEYDDGEEEEAQVYLGFLRKPKAPEELQRHRFPDKAGGAPAWLDPVNLPSGEACLCGFCGEPLRFAVQARAPLPPARAYHRALIVLMCPSMACLRLDQREQQRAAEDGAGPRRRSVKVFRCQLPRDNAFYSSAHGDCSSGDESVSDDDAPPRTTCTGVAAAPLCNWCATWRAETPCTRCGAARFCSETHLERHLRSCHGDGTVASSDDAPSSASGPDQAVLSAGAVWPEYVMYGKPEKRHDLDAQGSAGSPAAQELQSDDDDADDIDGVSAWMDAFEAGDDDDAARWASFQARFNTAGQGQQVLRYCSDATARPLWAAASGCLAGGAAPPCAHCGAPRLYELQLMPQLLHFLRVEARDPDPLDWATVVVYTCARSCDGGGGGEGGYKEEFAWVQLQPAT